MTDDQQVQIEKLFSKTNELAVEQGKTATRLDGIEKTVGRMEGKLDQVLQAPLQEANRRSDRALGWVVNVVGWSIALLLLILKEVLAK